MVSSSRYRATTLLLILFMLQPAGLLFAQEYLPTEEDALTFLQENVPDAHEELLSLKEIEPRAYEEELLVAREMLDMVHRLRQTRPDLAKRLIESEQLDYESHRLAERIVQSSDVEVRRKLKKELEDLLIKIFSVRMEGREFELKDLEQELTSLREEIQKRKLLKETIIKRRIEELLQTEDGELLEW